MHLNFMNHKDTEAPRAKLNELSYRVIGFCIEVHREPGPGLLASAHEEALAFEQTRAGFQDERQRDLPRRFKGIKLNFGDRLGMVVAGELWPVHHAQPLTCLKLERRALGLLLNFNAPILKDGLRRVTSGDLFKEEKQKGAEFLAIIFIFCASVSWPFKNKF